MRSENQILTNSQVSVLPYTLVLFGLVRVVLVIYLFYISLETN